MVPIRDNNPTQITPLVTYTLIAINLCAFVYEMSLGDRLQGFFQTWAIVPSLLTQNFQGLPTGLPFPAWITLITSQFLHGGILHLGGNMLYLWVFGNNVEDRLGHLKFLIFYLLCGVLAGLAQWYFSALSATPTLGASGAIAGVMGAYVLRFPKAEIVTLIPLGFFFWTFRIPAMFFLGVWFIQQAFFSFFSLNLGGNTDVSEGGVAYWAHAGGFVFGAMLGPLFGLFSDPSVSSRYPRH